MRGAAWSQLPALRAATMPWSAGSELLLNARGASDATANPVQSSSIIPTARTQSFGVERRRMMLLWARDAELPDGCPSKGNS